MVWKAISSQWSGSKKSALKKFSHYFIFCFVPFYLFLYIMPYQLVVGLLIVTLALAIHGVEEELKIKERAFEEEQAVQLEIKEKSLEERLHKAKESISCLLDNDRYELKSGITKGASTPIYLHEVPDFIYDILDIPESDRQGDTTYYIEDPSGRYSNAG